MKQQQIKQKITASIRINFGNQVDKKLGTLNMRELQLKKCLDHTALWSWLWCIFLSANWLVWVQPTVGGWVSGVLALHKKVRCESQRKCNPVSSIHPLSLLRELPLGVLKDELELVSWNKPLCSQVLLLVVLNKQEQLGWRKEWKRDGTV